LDQDLANVRAISAAWRHSLVLGDDGVARAWGDNAFGQLGDGTTVSRSQPVIVGPGGP